MQKELFNNNQDISFLYCNVGNSYKRENLFKFIIDNGFSYNQSDLTSESFSFANIKELEIKNKIEKVGTPLKDWDININCGIKTGFNEAFIISTQKKEEILNNCKDSIELEKTKNIIKPVIRGRDIKKYSYEWADLWLINSHNGVREKNIPPIDINDYPAIKNHLDNFYPQLEKRSDKGNTPYNLRNCAYLEEFEKEKIVWAGMTKNPCFIYDDKNNYINQTCYFSSNLTKYHLSLLNSNLIFYYFNWICSTLGDGALIWTKQYVELIPIPQISEEKQKPFEILVDYIMFLKKVGLESDANYFENIIDVMVYGLYFEESMKKHECFINDEIENIIQPLEESEVFVKNMIKTLKQNRIIERGLIFSVNVGEVETILKGEKVVECLNAKRVV